MTVVIGVVTVTLVGTVTVTVVIGVLTATVAATVTGNVGTTTSGTRTVGGLKIEVDVDDGPGSAAVDARVLGVASVPEPGAETKGAPALEPRFFFR